jgi:hypothetical protein
MYVARHSTRALPCTSKPVDGRAGTTAVNVNGPSFTFTAGTMVAVAATESAAAAAAAAALVEPGGA